MRFLLPFFLLPSLAAAQSEAWHPLDSRLLNLPTLWTVGASTLEVLFLHRFTATVQQAGGENLYGLDSPADVGLGLALGLGSRGQLELYRSNFWKEVELAGKWIAIPLTATHPWGFTLRGGGVYRGAFHLQPRWSAVFQGIVGLRPRPAWELALLGGWASDTPTLRRAANLALQAVYSLPRRWRLQGEVIAANPKSSHGKLAWALGVTKSVPGHSFTLYLGNSRATTSDLWVGSDFPGGLPQGQFRLGFNLVRRFPE
jgi:hypothetical protein